MQFHQLLRQRQPEPGAFVCLIRAAPCLAERFKHELDIFRRDADAGIADAYHDTAAFAHAG